MLRPYFALLCLRVFAARANLTCDVFKSKSDRLVALTFFSAYFALLAANFRNRIFLLCDLCVLCSEIFFFGCGSASLILRDDRVPVAYLCSIFT